MSSTQAGILAVVPVLCFSAGAFLAPRILVSISPNFAIGIALLAIAMGGIVRLSSSVVMLFAGTVICGGGAALGNVIGGVVARRDFAKNLGVVMGLYVGAISISAALAEIVSYPIAERFGSWRFSLGLWSVLPLVVLFVWMVTQRSHSDNTVMQSGQSYKHLMRNKAAWWLVIFFGLQSTNFHSLVGWLPTILRDAGISATSAGAMTSLMVFLGFPAGILIPIWAVKFDSQRRLVTGIVVIHIIGLLGVLLMPVSGAWLWSILLGVGLGASFPLALTIVLTKSDSSSAARDLSSFMHSWGYLISAIGPVVLGALHDASGTWVSALWALIIATVVQLIAGLFIAGPGHIHLDEELQLVSESTER